jgi:hypothetical protein
MIHTFGGKANPVKYGAANQPPKEAPAKPAKPKK